MRRYISTIILAILFISLLGCSSNIKLIDKTKTVYSKLKFYKAGWQDKPGVRMIYAAINVGGKKVFYSFYPHAIFKAMEMHKELSYTLVYQQPKPPFDCDDCFQRLSSLDSMVLWRGDSLLSVLGLNNFQKSTGATGFSIVVNWYHGYPKHRRFRPL